MAAADYISVEEVKIELRIESTDTTDDARLASCVTAVSRVWDGLCDRENGEFVASSAVKFYDVSAPNFAESMMDPLSLGGFQVGHSPTWSQTSLFVDEFVSLTSLKTDADGDGVYEITWAAADYFTYPANESPKDEIICRPAGRYQFPVGYQTVRLDALFGFSVAVPETVKRGCLFLVSRFRARILSPEGLKGSEGGEMVEIARMDPDVQMILTSGRLRKSSKSGLHFSAA